MTPLHYILDENNVPVPMESALGWAKWLAENEDRSIVAQTDIETPDGPRCVSTVFLGIARGFSFMTRFDGIERAPVLWETMIFGPPAPGDRHRTSEDYQERYSSHAGAVAGHYRACAIVRERSAGSAGAS